MKKLMSLVLAILLGCGMVVPGVGEDAEEPVVYQYNVKEDGTAEITGTSNVGLEVIDIPAEIDGYQVTSIKYFAFENCPNVVAIHIPEGITEVQSHAFISCSRLKEVSIPNSLVSIGVEAFESNKLTEIKVSPYHPVYAVENEALIDKRDMTLVRFLGPEMTGTYEISPGIQKIGKSAFAHARISSLVLPDSVESIENDAFRNCENLQSINIPDSVTEIGDHVFARCYTLTSIQVSPDHPVFEYVDLVLVRKENREMIAASSAISDKYVIPENILSIAEYAFQWCGYLDEVYIPENVHDIGPYSFPSDCVVRVCEGSAAEDDCAEYKDRIRYTVMSPEKFAEAVQQVKEENANRKFSSNPYIRESKEPPKNVCGYYHYYVKEDGTAGIDKVDEFIEDGNIPAELDGYKVTSIDEFAFQSCSELKSIVIPEGVTSLGIYPFDLCRQLESVSIPSTLVEIERTPFVFCPKLQNIEVSPDNPVLKVEDGMLINQKDMTLVYVLDHEDTGIFTIPEGIREIADFAMESTRYSSIILPDSVSIIGSHVFSECENLKELVLPEGVTSIDSQALYGSDSLESITIPDSMEHIGEGFFGSNKALTRIIISPENKNYEMIDQLLVDKRNMCIVGALNSIPAVYEIPEGIKEIGYLGFQGCYDLEELIVPEGVTYIGGCAFSGCSNLKKITLPESMEKIGFEAFDYCSGLVIEGKENSWVKEYCEANGYRFERSSNN